MSLESQVEEVLREFTNKIIGLLRESNSDSPNLIGNQFSTPQRADAISLDSEPEPTRFTFGRGGILPNRRKRRVDWTGQECYRFENIIKAVPGRSWKCISRELGTGKTPEECKHKYKNLCQVTRNLNRSTSHRSRSRRSSSSSSRSSIEH